MPDRLSELNSKINQFVSNRNWDQFHSPKNLSMALAGEVGELIEIFQWISEKESSLEELSELNYQRAKEELADIFIYTLRLSEKLEVDIVAASEEKLELNKDKYPIELSKGISTKYNQLGQKSRNE